MNSNDENVCTDVLNNVTGFVVLHQNIRSLRENFDLFLSELSTVKRLPDVIVLSEIWIKESEKQLYVIENYTLYVKTNELFRAGGIAIYVHNRVVVIQSILWESIISADILQINFRLKQIEFVIIAMYRHHKQPKECFLESFKQLLDHEKIKKHKNFCIIGDINLNLLEDSNIMDDYKITFSRHGFESLINEPTRITKSSKTCIDHAFVKINNRNKIKVNSVVIDNRVTDHCAVAVWFDCLPLGGDSAGGGYSGSGSDAVNGSCFRQYLDHNKLHNLLANADWSVVYLQNNASDAFNVFSDLLLKIIADSKTLINSKGKIKKLKPWINLETCKRIKTKNLLLKKVKMNPSNDELKKYFKDFRNNLQRDKSIKK
jgi:exonuclease III